MGDFKQHTLKCAPFHRDLSVHAYFLLQENVDPPRKGVILSIPGFFELYTKYFSPSSFWVHADFPGQPTDVHKIKFPIAKNSWSRLSMFIRDSYLFIMINGLSYPGRPYCKIFVNSLVTRINLFGSLG